MLRSQAVCVAAALSILAFSTGTGDLKADFTIVPGVPTRSGDLSYVETNFSVYGMDACYTTCSNGALTTVSSLRLTFGLGLQLVLLKPGAFAAGSLGISRIFV
jgi:hypothetical protein